MSILTSIFNVVPKRVYDEQLRVADAQETKITNLQNRVNELLERNTEARKEFQLEWDGMAKELASVKESLAKQRALNESIVEEFTKTSELTTDVEYRPLKKYYIVHKKTGEVLAILFGKPYSTASTKPVDAENYAPLRVGDILLPFDELDKLNEEKSRR